MGPDILTICSAIPPLSPGTKTISTAGAGNTHTTTTTMCCSGHRLTQPATKEAFSSDLDKPYRSVDVGDKLILCSLQFPDIKDVAMEHFQPVSFPQDSEIIIFYQILASTT